MKRHWSVILCGSLAICLSSAGGAAAQEQPQKGQSAGRLEMSQQIRAASGDSFEEKQAESLRHSRKKPLMTPLQSTDAFLELDRNHDMRLTRSELPERMSILRMQFDKYDLDHDHRLSYSEFANYTDVASGELVDSP
ncbi:EF-hand domain-containing protein [Rhodanobacter umsongensis]|uniref:EF-hand domain-containing protein n=1 Tax=Rhodanobacter umsongensis TaxID=633153 RepID=A0ABW0JKA2_9GAMM